MRTHRRRSSTAANPQTATPCWACPAHALTAVGEAAIGVLKAITRVQLLDLRQRHVDDRAPAVGLRVDSAVMVQHDMPIGGELQIRLQRVRAHLQRERERLVGLPAAWPCAPPWAMLACRWLWKCASCWTGGRVSSGAATSTATTAPSTIGNHRSRRVGSAMK
jgi:hypothetical protein